MGRLFWIIPVGPNCNNKCAPETEAEGHSATGKEAMESLCRPKMPSQIEEAGHRPKNARYAVPGAGKG